MLLLSSTGRESITLLSGDEHTGHFINQVSSFDIRHFPSAHKLSPRPYAAPDVPFFRKNTLTLMHITTIELYHILFFFAIERENIFFFLEKQQNYCFSDILSTR